MKIRKVRRGTIVRCIAWYICQSGHCNHHNFHTAHGRCSGFNQVKYCQRINEFVTDVPADEIDKSIASDPNLAFRFKKDVERGVLDE